MKPSPRLFLLAILLILILWPPPAQAGGVIGDPVHSHFAYVPVVTK